MVSVTLVSGQAYVAALSDPGHVHAICEEYRAAAVGVWRRWADDVRGDAVPAGHFFPEERPCQTSERLREFLESGK